MVVIVYFQFIFGKDKLNGEREMVVASSNFRGWYVYWMTMVGWIWYATGAADAITAEGVGEENIADHSGEKQS